MRATSNPACARNAAAASLGTTPSEASASDAASSTSSHCWKRFWSFQIRPISGRVYRAIMSSVLKDFRRLVLRGDRKARAQVPLLERLCGDQAYDLGMVVLFGDVAQHQVGRGGAEILRDVVADQAVRQMPYPAHHPLLDRPWIRSDLQHIEVVIRLHQQQIGAAQVELHRLGEIAEIGRNADPDAVRLQAEPNGIDRIVRDAETLHLDIADRNARAGLEGLQPRTTAPIDA